MNVEFGGDCKGMNVRISSQIVEVGVLNVLKCNMIASYTNIPFKVITITNVVKNNRKRGLNFLRFLLLLWASLDSLLCILNALNEIKHAITDSSGDVA